ncbi:High-affinity branched-chain amino acid transport system permease protein LivH [Pelotomaculum schinkii]|uniref:High-affinity branched-chain amino acid transport system permease protein LivH n=1 Tax=Pelotomaculum schinkii TaxID=78350 RepID=A0A4Y7RGZ9_9FIRM|nr:branched-chain amino acid ABC transporter permease [Pelotomaculum schinkii]TEB08030.1 High-affinity branched-chain amino acid transport system permease protein LivH [Pelotomaculum schinkii]
MTLSSQLLQLFISGLTMGSIYALTALALVLTFNITGVLNLALGEFLALGALLAASLYAAGLPLAAAFLIAVAAVAVLAGLLERVAVKPAIQSSVLTLVVITVGISISLRGLALLIWGTDPVSLPAFSEGGPLVAGGAAINLQSLWIVGLLAAALAGLYAFFELTYAGKAVRACVINRTAARLVGINPSAMSFAAFIASGALGAAAGIFITPVTLATYDMGFLLGVKGFVAAVLGGMQNVGGAVLGGLLLGLLEAYGAGLVSSGLKDALALLVLLAVLLMRPEGLFSPAVRKV